MKFDKLRQPTHANSMKKHTLRISDEHFDRARKIANEFRPATTASQILTMAIEEFFERIDKVEQAESRRQQTYPQK